MQLSLDRDTLIQALRDNKQEAISKLYSETIKKIYRYIYFRVNNEQDAEDITEDVYIKLIDQLESYDAGESISSWIYQIARTKIADYWREKYKVSGDFLERLFTSQFAVEENAEAEEKAKSILSLLPKNYAKVLELRFLKGYSIKESAKELNETEANIKVLQHRALKKAASNLV